VNVSSGTVIDAGVGSHALYAAVPELNLVSEVSLPLTITEEDVKKAAPPRLSQRITEPEGARRMSFQAYLDAIEDKTGLTPRELIALAHERGFDDPATKASAIVGWLGTDYGLGRGHAMALVHVIKKGPQIDAKHVDSGGTHSDPSDMLWLDGKATNPAG
jgi:hypothetical protein